METSEKQCILSSVASTVCFLNDDSSRNKKIPWNITVTAKRNVQAKETLTSNHVFELIGHLHDVVILLPRPVCFVKSFKVVLSLASKEKNSILVLVIKWRLHANELFSREWVIFQFRCQETFNVVYMFPKKRKPSKDRNIYFLKRLVLRRWGKI